jgi:hypothetical protein
MTIRNLGQSMRIILSALSAGALIACAQEAVPAPTQPVATKDACDEATDYAHRAGEAPGPQVKEALQRIADTKQQECAAKTNVSRLVPGAPSASGAPAASQ